MRILVPVEITPEKIVSSNAPADEVADYDPAVEYKRGKNPSDVGDLVVEGDTVYEYVGAEPSIGLSPVEGEKQDPKKWIVYRTVNPAAMWNGIIGDTTASDEPWPEGDGNGIQVVIEPGKRVGGVAFFGLRNVDAIRIEQIDPADGSVVFDETRTMRSLRGINSYWAWFNEPIERRVDAFFDKLPPVIGQLRISLQAAGSQPAECGACLPGPVRQYGLLQWRSGGGVMSFTTAERSRYGRLELRRGEVVKTGAFRVSMYAEESDSVIRGLSQIEGIRVVFIGTEIYETALIYGIYQGLNFVYENRAFHNYTMEVLGLT